MDRSAADIAPIGDDELEALFAALLNFEVVVLGVSGGADSTALMQLATRWRSRRDKGPRIVAATVDHGLRAASAAEATAVKLAATALGLPHHTVQWQHPKPASGLQAAARDARYRLMDQVLREHLARAPPRGLKHGPRGAVVTAHTLDDQAETFVMRLARGSGVDGLSAMAPLTVYNFEVDGSALQPRQRSLTLVRPLLDVARERLIATLRQSDTTFVVDPSNSDTRFERVRIRQALLALDAAGVSPRAIARSANRLRHSRQVAQTAAQHLVDTMIEQPFGLYVRLMGRGFQAADFETGLRAFRHALDRMRGASPAASLSTVERAYERLFRFRGEPGELPPAFTISGCHVVPRSEPVPTKTGHSQNFVVHVYREEQRDGGLEVVRLLPGEAVHWDRRFHVAVVPGWRSSVTIGPLGDDWAVLKDIYPELDSVALPAAAARTMPCVRRADGHFACPVLASAAATLRQKEQDRLRLRPSLPPTPPYDPAIPGLLDRAARGTMPSDNTLSPARVTMWRWSAPTPDENEMDGVAQ